MNFSTNQVMQFYVADATATAQKNLDGSVVVKFGDRVSDKIENVMWGKLTSAAALEKKYKTITVALNGAVKEGADYIVRVSYPEVAGLGIEGWTTKTAVAHAAAGMDAEDIYEELAKALEVAFAADGVLEVDTTGGLRVYAADATALYKRGVRPVVLPDFKVEAGLIEGSAWATVTTGVLSGRVVKGGYALAEMEYFAMGERGDQYRMMGWPDVIPTDYKVVPENEYDVLVVHYAYKGANEGDYKSEKDLIIAGAKGALDTLAKNISKETGVTFTKVTTGEAAIEIA